MADDLRPIETDAKAASSYKSMPQNKPHLAVYFKQHCRKCQAGLNPYRVESIQCQVCCKTRCICDKKQRHIDMRRPHRQDLCGRCKGKGLSCDTIYSFKYIV